MTKVVFPCDQDTWWLVKDRLHNLRDMCLQSCDLAQMAEAHQAIVNINLGRGDSPPPTYGNCVMYGLVKYHRKYASSAEVTHFQTVVMPTIIDLALKVEALLPTDGITICQQQRGETRYIERQLCSCILACAFLCLFPNEQRGFRTKLNNINFNKFFANLPIPSQNAKLLCILHYFERMGAEWDRLKGSLVFTRQVVKWEELPTLDTWLNCSTRLCAVKVCHEGLIEDAGPHCLEVDFANRQIGGGAVGRGRVQEEIRFTVCPELIVSMLFMETMDDNEAIIIRGYEQFAMTEGYAADLKFAGSYRDTTELAEDGNLLRALCAIDAVSYRGDRSGLGREQYEDSHMMRDINKAFIGFCMPFSAPNGTLSEEDYFTADEDDSSDEDESGSFRLSNRKKRQIDKFVDGLLKQALALALPEAINNPNFLSVEEEEPTTQITPRSDSSNEGPPSQNTHGSSEGEPPMAHLEVNFRDWYAHYRRRSSNLSDLSSRRSSYDQASRRSSGCSTRGYSSEFSSEFEEYYDNFVVQEQKYKYHTIKEEVGTALIYEFAAGLAANLLREGTHEASHNKDTGVQDFRSEQPSNIFNKPQPLRMSADRELCSGDSNNNVGEKSARKFVENMFASVWPFDGKSDVLEVSDENEDKTEVLDRIMEGCSNIPNTLQNSDNESEKCITEDGSTTDLEEMPLDDIDGAMVEGMFSSSLNTSAEAEVLSVDENILIDVADRIVNIALEEGLAEYRYRYMCNQPRPLVSQMSSESSQSEHSIEIKQDQLEASMKQAQSRKPTSDLSNRPDSDTANNSSQRYEMPAVTVAENIISELFKQETSGSGRRSGHPVVPKNKSDCDNNNKESDSIDTPQQQYLPHSTSKSDSSRKPKSDKHLEMYNRIAERLLKGEFVARTVVEEESSQVVSEKLDSQARISLDTADGHVSQDSDIDQSQTSDTHNMAVFQQNLSECDNNVPSRSTIPSNRSPNNLSALSDSYLSGERSLSRSGSEKSKSSRLSDKRSSSGSSESRGSGYVGNSLTVHPKDSMMGKISPENSNSSANQSSGSDKTGSESSIPKVKLTGYGFNPAAAENWQGARPKTTKLKVPNSHHHHHHHHHVVGGKKNYDQFANSLSRDLLTNAFLQVQEHSDAVYFPRRSSEPMQISNGAALQRLENSVHIMNGRRTQKSKTDEDLREFEESLFQDCSFNGMGYGKNSSGFRDPLLSRFAEELMKANVSVPQLQLLGDCVSTSGSSRSVCSTISSFKDPLLASFEEELLLNVPVVKSAAKTQMSWSKMKSVMCSPRLGEPSLSFSNNGGNSRGSSCHGNNSVGSYSNNEQSLSVNNRSSFGSSSHSNNSNSNDQSLSVNNNSRSSHVGNSLHSNNSASVQKRRVNSMSMDSEASNLSAKSNKSNSVLLCSGNVAEYAETLARRILCEAFTAAVCDRTGSQSVSRRRMTVDMFSEMLAGSIIQSAIGAVDNDKLCSAWLEQNRMSHPGPIVTWSDETECLEYSGEEEITVSSETDTDNEKQSGSSSCRSTTSSSCQDWEDALDVPWPRLEEFADMLASNVIVNSVAIMRREKISTLRKQFGRPISTGNWGCGAFRGDPQLKSLLQWMAASYAGAPEMLFYTFKNPKMARFQDVIDTVSYRGWDVAALMQAVRRYCLTTENEIRLTGAASRELFDVIIQGEVFPGT